MFGPKVVVPVTEEVTETSNSRTNSKNTAEIRNPLKFAVN